MAASASNLPVALHDPKLDRLDIEEAVAFLPSGCYAVEAPKTQSPILAMEKRLMCDHRMTLCIGFTATVCAMILPASAVAVEMVELKAKFKPGHVTYYEKQDDTEQSMDGPMGKMHMKSNQTTGVMLKVESSSKDHAKISMTFDRMKVTMDAPPMVNDMSYDTDLADDGSAPQLMQVLTPMVGSTITLELDQNNQATSAAGIEEMLAKIEKTAGQNPFFIGMKQALNEERAKQDWNYGHLAILPNKKVKAGDQWDMKLRKRIALIGSEVTVVYDCNCKLDRVTEEKGRKIAVITFSGKSTGLAEAAMPQSMKVESGTLSGTAKFDINSGELFNAVQNIATKISAESPAGGPRLNVELKKKETSVHKSSSERKKEKRENEKKAEMAKKATADKNAKDKN
ncbi:MAG: DUF6263 family protein [Phycisphaerales bacterium]|nr:DUF6263 family protein [Phycisphaerales bacterium]